MDPQHSAGGCILGPLQQLTRNPNRSHTLSCPLTSSSGPIDRSSSQWYGSQGATIHLSLSPDQLRKKSLLTKRDAMTKTQAMKNDNRTRTFNFGGTCWPVTYKCAPNIVAPLHASMLVGSATYCRRTKTEDLMSSALSPYAGLPALSCKAACGSAA